jgi:hypothetical protein
MFSYTTIIGGGLDTSCTHSEILVASIIALIGLSLQYIESLQQ